MKPQLKPQNPNFSSGPCSKRPGYDLTQLDASTLGRSHRSSLGKAVLAESIEKPKRYWVSLKTIVLASFRHPILELWRW